MQTNGITVTRPFLRCTTPKRRMMKAALFSLIMEKEHLYIRGLCSTGSFPPAFRELTVCWPILLHLTRRKDFNHVLINHTFACLQPFAITSKSEVLKKRLQF